MTPYVGVGATTQESHVQDFLRAAAGFLSTFYGAISIIGTVAFIVLVEKYLPEFEGIKAVIGFFALSTFLYGSTFYTSTYFVSRNLSPKVMRLQLLSIFIFAVAVVCCMLAGIPGATAIAAGSVIKMFSYWLLMGRLFSEISRVTTFAKQGFATLLCISLVACWELLPQLRMANLIFALCSASLLLVFSYFYWKQVKILGR
jgi:hypothetical protein